MTSAAADARDVGHGVRPEYALDVRGLSVRFRSSRGDVAAVTDVSLKLRAGETLGLVGESGSGKSVTALSLVRLIEPPGEIYDGEVVWNGRNLLASSNREIETVRGREIAIIFQDPLAYLNPVKTIGSQLTEPLRVKLGMSKKTAARRGAELLGLVGLQDPRRRLDDYPHQLSGGMRQRALIAMAIACEPKLLIADEPTTALDVTVQAGILKLLKRLQGELGMALILITHDLAVAAGVVDRVSVMYAGRIVETGSANQIFLEPLHPYTIALLESVPRLDKPASARLISIPGTPPDPASLPPGCAFAERCGFVRSQCTQRPDLRAVADGQEIACWVDVKGASSPDAMPSGDPPLSPDATATVPSKGALVRVEDMHVTYDATSLFGRGRHTNAVDGVSFEIARGETIGLVGESGSGKSTLAMSLLQLIRASSGSVIFEGQDLTRLGRKDLRVLRRDMQIVFQDPYASLDPRHTVGSILTEPLALHGVKRAERREKVTEMLNLVGLSPRAIPLYPYQFSGGQRQRIAIARALMLRPRLVVCDEPVSALDVSIRAQVLNLLKDLQRELSLTYLFITHDLGIVRQFCDRVLVMYRGVIVESGPADAVLDNPRHPYTQALLSAVPVPDPRTQRARLEQTLALGDSALNAQGCRFAHRCPLAQEICRSQEPALDPVGDAIAVACHLTPRSRA